MKTRKIENDEVRRGKVQGEVTTMMKGEHGKKNKTVNRTTLITQQQRVVETCYYYEVAFLFQRKQNTKKKIK